MKKYLFVLLAALLFFVTGQAVQAQESAVPFDWSLNDDAGKRVAIRDLAEDKGMVLIFIRSLDWCPYCKGQIKDIQSNLTKFEELGFHPVAISYDGVEDLRRFKQKENITFPLLSDPNSQIIQAFGLLNTEYEKGSRFYGIPNPAIYVLTAQGAVLKKYQEQGYKKRPDIQVILEFLAQH